MIRKLCDCYRCGHRSVFWVGLMGTALPDEEPYCMLCGSWNVRVGAIATIGGQRVMMENCNFQGFGIGADIAPGSSVVLLNSKFGGNTIGVRVGSGADVAAINTEVD